MTCVNGHPVAPVRVHNCPVCGVGVVYEPAPLVLAALDRAHVALDTGGGHTPETRADRQRWSQR